MTDHLTAALTLAGEHAGIPVAAEVVACRIRRSADPDAELARQLDLIERDGRRAA
jgi:hypothetical protein